MYTYTPNAPSVSVNNLITSSQVELTIAPGSNGGSAITSYKIYIDGNYTGSIAYTGLSTIYRATGLKASTQYNFIVTPVNDIGEGSPSAPSITTTLNGPIIDYIFVSSSTQVIFKIKNTNITQRNPITSYNVYVNGILYMTGADAISESSIYDLTPGTTYNFTVSGVSLDGEGAQGQPFVKATYKDIVQNAPSFTTSVISGTEIDLYITPPIDNNGWAIETYNIYINDIYHGSVSYQPWVSTTTIYKAILSGGTYTFTVSAVNYIGESVKSPPQTQQTIITVPGAPVFSANYEIDNRRVRIDIISVNSGGLSISGYSYSLNDGNSWVFTGNANTFYITINHDATYIYQTWPGIAHNIRVRATNSLGNGLSNVVSLTVPNVPASPTITATYDNVLRLIRIAINTPINDGGAPVTKYFYRLQSGIGYTQAANTSNPIIVNNIYYGNTYNIDVSLMNGMGQGPASNIVHIETGIVAPYAAALDLVTVEPINQLSYPNMQKYTLTWYYKNGGSPPLQIYLRSSQTEYDYYANNVILSNSDIVNSVDPVDTENIISKAALSIDMTTFYKSTAPLFSQYFWVEINSTFGLLRTNSKFIQVANSGVPPSIASIKTISLLPVNKNTNPVLEVYTISFQYNSGGLPSKVYLYNSRYTGVYTLDGFINDYNILTSSLPTNNIISNTVVGNDINTTVTWRIDKSFYYDYYKNSPAAWPINWLFWIEVENDKGRTKSPLKLFQVYL